MEILTLDFETYYSKDYSLSKLTTEEYVRDSRFEVIGVAVKKSSFAKGRNYHHRDAAGPMWCTGSKKQIAKFLSQFDWSNSVAVAHNAMFDMAILNWHFGIKPKKIADTLSMSRALHAIEVSHGLAALSEYYALGKKGTEVHDAIGKKRLDFTPEEIEAYGGYCIQDVELTFKLFQEFLNRGFSVTELNLIDLTIRMFTEPALELDIEVLTGHLEGVLATKAELMDKVSHEKTKLTSNPQFAELLQEYGVKPPVKISLTTGKETFAFAKSDEGFKALQDHENPSVQALVAARLGVRSTIEEKRTERFISIGKRGKLPIPLRYYAAHTGRWGGDDKINMQNLPRGSALKKAMCAPEGYKFVDCDLSQIEARTLAWLAEEEELVQAFDRGDDVYKIMASAIYDKPEEDISKEERFVGKTTILGAGYGMGAVKFRNQLKTFGVELEQEECDRIINVYRTTYKNIPKLWRSAGKSLKQIMNDKCTKFGRPDVITVEGDKGILLPNGLHVKYPNLRTVTDELGDTETLYDTRRGKAIVSTRIYGGKVIENVCQALARIVIGEQLLRVAKRYKVVMTVHDAIGCIVPEKEVEQGLKYVEDCMKTRPVWASDLPLDCEGGYGDSYGAC
mgnify:FL=1|tara:strand:- start:48663 stop:50525 length:1863 start_codon:yes stop_codon:yes gene_type:complete